MTKIDFQNLEKKIFETKKNRKKILGKVNEKLKFSKFRNFGIFNFSLTFPRDFCFDFFSISKNIFRILKINFRHEKLIFFAQDFFF